MSTELQGTGPPLRRNLKIWASHPSPGDGNAADAELPHPDERISLMKEGIWAQ